MEREFTIKQVQDILDWSYPTALKFAQRYGRMEENGHPVWYVPAQAVNDELRRREEEVAKSRRAFREMVAV